MRWAKLVGRAVGVVDRAAVAAVQARGRQRAHSARPSHAERLRRLVEARRRYEGYELLSNPERFFPAPRELSFTIAEVRAGVWEASWPSAYEPFLPDVGERWHARIDNRTARARLYLAGRPDRQALRPAIVIVHGYMGGQWVFEESRWPIEWFVRRGLDVALPLLPLHGPRAGARRGPPPFPSSDPNMTNEGFRQAITDIRSVVRWLRERGAPTVGVVGMSLGGYTAALLGTVTSEIDFVVPMLPLASIADFARDEGRLGSGSEASAQHAALDEAHRIVSPLSRPLQLPVSRALVVGAEHDRITPLAHAKRLKTHFGCEMLTIGGAHLVQIGRRDAFRALATLLEREAIVAPHGARS